MGVRAEPLGLQGNLNQILSGSQGLYTTSTSKDLHNILNLPLSPPEVLVAHDDDLTSIVFQP